MIRVIYRWEVAPDDFDAFNNAWRRTTHRIHASIAGALGSFLVRACDKRSEVLTVARWTSMDAWAAFWGNADPQAMQEMRKLGKRISVEVFDEIEDHTR